MNQGDYLKRRAELTKIRDDSMESFDKTVLAVSSGALALSITFLDKIGKPYNLLTFLLIIASWLFMFSVFIFNILSFVYAKKNMDDKITDLDERRKKDEDEDPNHFTKYRDYTHRCNNICLYSFLLSVIFFISYIILIQKNNYTILKNNQKQEVSSMNEKQDMPDMLKNVVRHDAKTEAPAPLAQRVLEAMNGNKRTEILTEGKTEVPGIGTKGKTEVSPAVAPTTKPNTQGGGTQQTNLPSQGSKK